MPVSNYRLVAMCHRILAREGDASTDARIVADELLARLHIPAESCCTCGGRGVVDAHDVGDGYGGMCPDCDGTGQEK